MNARPPSFGNSQCIEGNRHVNRQLQYYGKEMTKICMAVIGKVHLIIHVEKQECLKKLDSETVLVRNLFPLSLTTGMGH